MKVGLEELERLLDEADYETNCDPYRGLFSSQPSPWRRCELTNEDSRPEEVASNDKSRCPTVVLWKTQIKASGSQKSKKRKREGPSKSHAVGKRPKDPQYGCSCDNNPV